VPLANTLFGLETCAATMAFQPVRPVLQYLEQKCAQCCIDASRMQGTCAILGRFSRERQVDRQTLPQRCCEGLFELLV